MRIAFDTLGCKLNQAETGALARQFAGEGHEVVGRSDPADIYILNTCTVTGAADSKARRLLRMARRRNPQALVVATGCYADRVPLELAKLSEVDLVTGNEGKPGLLKRLREEGRLPLAGNSHAGNGKTRSGDRARTFVKIQDGCRNFCAYCVVPYVRRGERSVAVENVIAEVNERLSAGHPEVVLTGTRIGAYAAAGTDLAGLVERILAETGAPRLRLSSLQPRELSPRLLALWRDKRLCPHFHLSLQSGSETVLKRMRRRYTPPEYALAVSLIRGTVPDVAVTTDVIVGFPGESDAEFEESLDFCRRTEFARIHVFPFSPRPGTEAAAMPGHVAEKVKRERTQRMLALAEQSRRSFEERYSGAELDVLWEGEDEDGVRSGMTGNYIRVRRQAKGNKP